MSKTYHMCRFEKVVDGHTILTTGWIEGRGAKTGAKVEIKGEEGLWDVVTVSESISLDEFRKLQTSSRAKWASLVDV